MTDTVRDGLREAVRAAWRQRVARGVSSSPDEHANAMADAATAYLAAHAEPTEDPEWLRKVASDAQMSLDRLPASARPTWYRHRVNGDDAWWESLVRAECQAGHVVYVDDGDGTVYACPVCALAARPASDVEAVAALDRLFDHTIHTAGDTAGRDRARNDYASVLAALLPPEPEVTITAATHVEWGVRYAFKWPPCGTGTSIRTALNESDAREMAESVSNGHYMGLPSKMVAHDVEVVRREVTEWKAADV